MGLLKCEALMAANKLKGSIFSENKQPCSVLYHPVNSPGDMVWIRSNIFFCKQNILCFFSIRLDP